MRRCARYLSLILILIGIFLTLSGCASTEPSRFYTLSTLSDKNMSRHDSPAIGRMSVGIGPIEIPDYLDRPQIVSRSGLNELKLAEYDRWAGSLSENITMAVRENLSLLLATDRVFAYPCNSPSQIDYKVAIKIVRLESVPGDHVALKALWTLTGGKDNKELTTRVSDIQERLNVSGYDAIVAAMSRTFASLSREIASEIIAIVETSKPGGSP